MDDNADAKRILLVNWRRQPGCPASCTQHNPTGSETPPPYTPQNSRCGSEPPSVEDAVDVWCYAILELHAGNDDDDDSNSFCIVSVRTWVCLGVFNIS